ncbi:MAG: hypothetical protein ACREXW_01010 [Gammaproteobacteria bacterium]
MKERKDAAWKKAAADWLKAKKAFGPAEKALENAKTALVGLLGNESAFGFGVLATRKSRKGNVDYSAIPQLNDLNLDKFRKADTNYFELSPSDG